MNRKNSFYEVIKVCGQNKMQYSGISNKAASINEKRSSKSYI
nr:hypothetical protein [uncultured Acetatifactor sp.]